MKRIILSVFAAAVTAAWVVPASAGDVTFSGQYRVRGEFVENNDYNDLTADSNVDSWTQRVRLTANAKASDDVSAKITLQDTRTWGTTTNQLTEGGNTLDFHEAYANVTNLFGTPVALRIGRQELNYGDQRLIGGFGWSNQGRAFDGAKLMYSTDAVNVDFFTTTITEDTSANNDDTYFHGIYATLKQLVPDNTLDVYLLNRTSGSLATGENRYTIGARLKGAVAGVDYTVELPYQFGEATSTVDIAAYAFAAKVGYTIPTPMKIRIGAEYDYATGADTDPAENENFNQLYPTNHNHFGIGDVVNTWSNISTWSVNAAVDLNEKTNISVAYWDYAVAETTAASDDLGSEIDVVATYKYNNNLSIEAGAARFSPGDATAVNGDDRDWAYLQITANF